MPRIIAIVDNRLQVILITGKKKPEVALQAFIFAREILILSLHYDTWSNKDQ